MDNHLNLKHIKIIGWFAIVSSIIGIATFLWLILFQGQLTNIGIWPILIVCILGIYAGSETIKNNYIGKKLLLIFSILQIFQFSFPSISIILYAGLTFTITSTSGDGLIGINLIAFVLLLLSIRMIREHKHITSRSRATAQ